MLRVLGAVTDREIHEQVFAAATGMNGAGRFRAQCGLVEGGLMFLGIWGHGRGRSPEEVENLCKAYAREFETRFGSLLCRDLRPQGFAEGQPQHLCEGLSVDAANWAAQWVGRLS